MNHHLPLFNICAQNETIVLHPKKKPDHRHRDGVFQRTPRVCDDGSRDVFQMDEQQHQHVGTFPDKYMSSQEFGFSMLNRLSTLHLL